MKGLIIKDLYGLRENARSSFFSLLIFIAIGVGTKNMMYITMMMTILGMNLTLMSMSYDESSNWTEYSLSMPISKRDLVLSKYIFSLIPLLIGAVVSLLIVFIGIYPRSDLEVGEILLAHYGVLAMVILLNAAIIPVVFKKGVEKARIAIFGVTIITVALVVGSIILIGNFTSGPMRDNIIKGILMISPIILFLIFKFSLSRSIKILEDKDL